MQHPGSTQQTDPPHDWDVLGRLVLTQSLDSDSAVQEWLGELLAPFALEDRFRRKVQTSAVEAIRRAMQPSAGHATGRYHLLVLVPADLAPACTCWGFFRIEKVESGTRGSGVSHTIELYIYPDVGDGSVNA